MPDIEETAQSATPVVESDQPQSSETELPDMADALRSAAQEAQPQDDDGDESDDDSADDTQASDEEPSEQDEAAKDADSAKPARPNQARRLKQRVSELETELQQHKGRADFYEQEKQQNWQELQNLLGSDQEYSALIQKRLDPEQMLSYDEESRYVQLTSERKNAAVYLNQARAGLRAGNEANVRAVASQHGMNPDELAPLAHDAGALLTKAISETEARVRKEMDDELTETKADRDAARLKLGGKAHDPGMGGRSGAHRPDHLNWDTAEPGDYFVEAQRQQARTGNGR